MAMGIGSSPRRGRGRSKRRAAIAEINVTPLVDVMLVLLIIFMVTAPLLTSGVPIELPDSRANPLDQEPDQVTISLDRQGQVFIDDERIALVLSLGRPAEHAKQLRHRPHVGELGHVAIGRRARRQQSGSEQRQRRVLRTADRNLAHEPGATFDDDLVHEIETLREIQLFAGVSEARVLHQMALR